MKKLLNPIEFFNDKKLLIANIIIFVIGTIISVFTKAWFCSIIQTLFKSKINAYETILENIICIILLTSIFYTAGKIANKKTRLLDCLNLSFFIRIPFYLVSLLNVSGILSEKMPSKSQDGTIKIPSASSSIDYIISITSSILSLIIIVYLIFLIYNSFKTLSNAKKTSNYLILMILFIAITIFSPTILNLI